MSLVSLDGRPIRPLTPAERIEAVEHLLGHRPWFEHLPARRQAQIFNGFWLAPLQAGPLYDLLNTQQAVKTWRLRVSTPYGDYDYTTAFVRESGTVHLQLVTDVVCDHDTNSEAAAATTNLVDLLQPPAGVSMGGTHPSGPHSGPSTCPPLGLVRLFSEVIRRAYLNTYAGGLTSSEREAWKVRHALSGLEIRGPGLPLADFTFVGLEQADFARAIAMLSAVDTSCWRRPYVVCIFIAEQASEDGEITVSGRSGPWRVHADAVTKPNTSGPYLVIGVADVESLARNALVAVDARAVVSRDWWASAASEYERVVFSWAQLNVEMARRSGVPVLMTIGGSVTIDGTKVFPDIRFTVLDIQPRLFMEVRGFPPGNTLDPEYVQRKDFQAPIMRRTDRYHSVDAAAAVKKKTWPASEYRLFDRVFLNWRTLMGGILKGRRRQ